MSKDTELSLPYSVIFSISWDISHAYMFHILKQILILDADNTSKQKMQYLSNNFIYYWKKESKTTWP